MAEQLERFARQPGVEIHLYSQCVQDLDCVGSADTSVCSSPVVWHRVSRLPVPQLFAYPWWFVANHLQRWWDSEVHGLKFDLVYSAGINALDADVISIHVIFEELRSRAHPLRFRASPVSLWPVILHRQLYYGLICLLERIAYAHQRNTLIAASQHTAASVAQLFHRHASVIRHGVDTNTFNRQARASHRERGHSPFGTQPSEVCVLLIGNDWRTKGLDTLLRAVADCPELPIVLFLVGSDDRRSYIDLIRSLKLEPKLRFLLPSSDVLQFYAAADVYVAPSLEDAFAMPVLEAMACGLPVIASARAGVSEIITNYKDGLILHNPEDHRELAALLRWICADHRRREQMGHEASLTAQRYTWDANAAQTWKLLGEAAKKKRKKNNLESQDVSA